MKILLVSYAFAPSIGGIETVSQILEAEFRAQGHEVTVVTWSDGPADTPPGVTVIRRPGTVQLLRLVRWADVVFHNNICLSAIWPQLLIRRPWVVAHHTWIARTDGTSSWRDQLKLGVLRWASNISISTAIAQHLPVPSTVIPNPYRDELFTLMPAVPRDRDIVFLGRLVSDKGVDVLIEALARLSALGCHPRCTIIGSGPDESALKTQAATAGLANHINFVGAKSGTDLVHLLNQHRIIAIPSRWREPFGLVALEGIACGCVAVVSHDGGLPDAAGPCGISVPNGDAAELATRLRELLDDPTAVASLRAESPQHLARHLAPAVARRYLEVLTAALGHP